jgi:hypothetical protein
VPAAELDELLTRDGEGPDPLLWARDMADGGRGDELPADPFERGEQR